MVDRLQLLRNVGQFDSVSAGAQLPLAAFTVVYAENGRGKTTLAAILRSLGTGDGDLVVQRRRLGAPNPPSLVVQIDGGAAAVFNGGTWSRTDPDLMIFDDEFVAQNVCAGIIVDPAQRQNLHELILGAQGVALSRTLQQQAVAVEAHNKELRRLADEIDAAARGGLTVDAFCALPPNPAVVLEIDAAQRRVAAAAGSARVEATGEVPVLTLPDFDLAALAALLSRGLPDLAAEAAAQVQSHVARLGAGGERWVSEGVQYQHRLGAAGADACPFCAQDLTGSPVVGHYQAYFSAGYVALKAEIADAQRSIETAHGGDQLAAYERRTREIAAAREFWKTFVATPDYAPDTAAVELAWKAARERVQTLLKRKQSAPLEALAVDAETTALVQAYRQTRATALADAAMLAGRNADIRLVKEEARGANLATLQADLARLQAVAARHGGQAAACAAYLAEKQAKATTEGVRDAARAALDDYRRNVFPTYQDGVNDYLRRFNAGFRLGGVAPMNVRGGSTATYNVVINNVPVSLSGEAGPSFRNTLSAGDRNTLALAFFFASLDADAGRPAKVVVIDDPMSSLDEHRTLHTVQEISRLAGLVRQVIVLSHSKPFLLNVWQSYTGSDQAALQLVRAADGSTLAAWDVNGDLVTDHDRMHAAAVAYLQHGDPAERRSVAASLRTMMERFARVAFPAEFPPGAMLGQLHGLSVQRLGTPREILGPRDTAELRALLDYANLFHHDTNATYQAQLINDAELVDFTRRTLVFITRPRH